MGKIADILQSRGELDEALRIRREEQLPVYERLGDVRARAVTMGKIADILQSRGDLDEALRIRREEELPVYERLGDVRSRAVTMGKIADILQSRGDLDEALRIRREEELPVYERLGDVRSRAVTMGKIADILQSRGDLDEALRIRRQEQLPVYERLGDVRARAVSAAKDCVGPSRHRRPRKGSHSGNLRGPRGILRNHSEARARRRNRGVGAMLAQIMAMGGLREEALAVLDQAEAAFQKLGKADGVAHVRQLREQIGKP